ncbi:Gfo/Idh/MocA family protein [Raoultibacter timonensis]|uniref:Oxidoreductase n=1 Tax=Raoultibacter timonensis TaxID=1907662 RepID=A0ABM7WIU6_9ACTN|nr:Gfo/Idh/MocA family oxidoreductase [Raoultibacter timonensis]BDE96234.1 oxidoreductase [Raoultibacter timonensis]BDF50839.1 oxidoreductase [Raoultibacter timonensis]
MSETLKVGVVGTGNMGKNHVRVLSTMAECQLVGCYDVNEALAKEQAQRYGIAAFGSPEELYAAVDVAHIVVPSFLHKEYAVAAAQAGCHVLVEKPIALNVEDAQAIIDACSDAGVRLCVGHVERFNPAISTLMNIIDQEEVISVDFRRMSPFYGRVSDASVVEDLMIHDVDVLNAIAGDAGIKRVASQGAKVYTDKLDYAQALVTYDNGLVASLTASRVTESKIRKAEISAKNCYIDVDYLNRTVEISRKTNFSLDVGYPVQYRQENIVEKVMVPISEPLRAEFEHFFSCIKDGSEIATSGEMGKRALELCERIQNEALVG